MKLFRRKAGGRRQEFSLHNHDEVLEVKAKTDARRGARIRVGTRIVLLAVLAVTGFVLWRQFRSVILEGWMYQTPLFALKEYPIETDGVLTSIEIQQTANVRPGQNLLALDLPAIRERLRMHPRIEDASVERVLPATLRLTIRERIPVARVNVLSAKGVEVHYLLDEFGYPMPPLEAGRVSAESVSAESGLPMLIGAPSNDFSPGRPTTQPEVLSAIKFLLAFDRSALAGLADVLSIDLTHRGVLVAVTSHGSTIALRPDNYEQQLRDWQRIWQEGMRVNRTIGLLDLAVSRNIPLKWQELAAAPASPTLPEKKSARPKRTRRNHV